MLSGRDTLKALSQALGDVRRDTARFDDRLAVHRSQLERLGLEETRLLRQLAALRLEDVEAGVLSESFSRAEESAAQIMADRDRAEGLARQQLVQVREQLEALEAERERVHQQVEAAAQALAEREAAAQAALDADATYQDQLTRTREAEGITVHAEEKTRQAETDSAEKGQSYKDDPLFSYLWERHYGTDEYAASGLTRTLDGWVARLCGYAEARPNFWMLKEIPKRLREHATAVRYQAEAELTKLETLEQTAASAAAVPEAQQRMHSAEAEQDRCDDAIDGAEVQQKALDEQVHRFAVGADEYRRRALDLLAEAYAGQRVERLSAMALKTLETEDDDLVRALADVRDARKDEQALLEEQQRARGRYAAQLGELEEIRRRFKRSRYDDLRSGFKDGNLLQSVLQEFLRGAVSSGRLWDTIKRQQRYQDVGGAWPDFGSGGFRRGGQRGPWHWPGGQGSFRLPKSGGSRSRGGFRTGGGF